MQPVRISHAEESLIRIIRAVQEDPAARSGVCDALRDLVWATHRARRPAAAAALKALGRLLPPQPSD